MEDPSIEARLEHLESQVTDVLTRLGKPAREKNWRRTIGMFADKPDMQEVFDAAEQERERDRQAFYAEFDLQEE